MRRGFQGVAVRQFTRLFESGTLSAASDRELLDLFAKRRDEAAFDVLMTRYGRLVLNVGRKLLHDPRDVEDAFQATFLVLIRKPPRLRVGDSLGPWLSTVAYRVAARARANRIRLNRMETNDGLDAAAPPSDSDSNALALHEELNRLPERLRRPVVCCYLEGLTHERAAERLGCPVGTVRSRLARARTLLHHRLSIRGVAPSVAPLEILLSSSNSIDPPLRLIDRTLRLATAPQSRWPEAGVASASLLSLVNGVVRMMNLKKALVLLSVALPLGGLAAVGAAQAYQQAAGERDKPVVDGRTFVAESGFPETYPVTYYVGDLMGLPKDDLRQALGDKPFDPIVKLITTTVAPGTWVVRDAEVHYPDGRNVNQKGGQVTETRRGGDRPIGSITPFFLSISLIIRHSAETHEQIADFLRNLRAVVNAAVARATTTSVKDDRGYLEYRENEDDDSIRIAKAPADPATIEDAGRRPRVPTPNKLRMMRMRAQLKALQSEMEALEKDLSKVEPQGKIPVTPVQEKPNKP